MPRQVSSYATRSDPRPEWLEKSHSQELTADSVGAVVALSVAAGGLAAEPTAQARAEISYCAGGIFLFFCLDRLINIVRRKLRERIYERAKQVAPPLRSMSTHPTAEERMRNVWNVFERVGDSAEMMRAVDILFQRLEEPTIERVWNLLVQAYTKGS